MIVGVNKVFALSIRLLSVVVIVGTVGFLLNRAVVPSGVLVASTDFLTPAPFFSYLKPAERAMGPMVDTEKYVTLIGHPIYVDFTPPSRFDTATVTMKYKNSGLPSIEIGALVSALTEQFMLVPVENRLIDGLAWPQISSGSLTLFQRVPRYASLDAFFANPPSRQELAVYGTKASVPFALDDYVASSESTSVEISLRGEHRLLTYVKNEPLNFTFFTQDMNRQEGADPVIVSVYRDGETDNAIARAVLEDDGNTSSDQVSSKIRKVSVSLTDPDEGVYQIEFTAPGDVFIRSIQTRQNKVVFAGKLHLGDHVGYSDVTDGVTLYGDGKRVVARTLHTESLQTISVGNERIVIDEPHTRFVATLPGSRQVHTVSSPKRDVLLESDGVFALRLDAYFNPMPFALHWYTDDEALTEAGIQYVLTSYEPPATVDDLREAKAVFRLDELAKTKECAYRFVIAIPGISETQYELQLASFEVTLRRERGKEEGLLGWLQGLFSGNGNDVENFIAPSGTSFGESPQ